MTASREAMFTATPVTVPARCLPGRKPLHQRQLPGRGPPVLLNSSYLSSSLPLILFQGSFTWMY